MSEQRTLAIIKPDVVEMRKQGVVLSRILDEGFRVLAMRQVQLSRAEVEGFYAEHQGKYFFDRLCEFMTSGPVVVLALSRQDAVAHWRQVLGATDPEEAAEGTIRKQFGEKTSRNAGHGSDSEESGARECAYFFSGTELLG